MQEYDPQLDNKHGWSLITKFKYGIVKIWLRLVHESGASVAAAYGRPHNRTITLDLTCGNGESITTEWFESQIWGLALQQSRIQAIRGIPQLVCGNERNIQEFKSLRHHTSQNLAPWEELTQVSETQWKATNLEIELHQRDSRGVALSDYGFGDLVIVIIDGNTIDMSAGVVNPEELVGLTQRGAIVFVFTTMKTQERIRYLPFEERRIDWRLLLNTVHLLTVPSLALQDSLYVVQHGFGKWIWEMTALSAWRPQFDNAIEMVAKSMKDLPKEAGGNPQGGLDITIISHQDDQKQVLALWREATVLEKEEKAIRERKVKFSNNSINAHKTMRRRREQEL